MNRFNKSKTSKSVNFKGDKSFIRTRNRVISAKDELEDDKNRAMQKFDPEKLPATYMYVSISGLIQSGTLKNSMFVRMSYDLVCGEGWDLVKGELSGVSQGGCLNYNKGDRIVWNLSFNALYRTLEIFGWPKIVMKFEGPDNSGDMIIKGYAICTIPICPGSHKIYCHIFRPIQPKMLGMIFDSQKVSKHTKVDPKIIAGGQGREVTTVEHMGSLRVDIHVSHKNFQKFGIMV